MTGAFVAIAIAFLVGLPIARIIDPRAGAFAWVGTSFLYGSGTIFLALLALSMLGLAWTGMSVGVVLIVVVATASFLAWRTRSISSSGFPGLHAIDVLTLATIAGYVLYATIASPFEVDFWAIWGLKARVFLEAGRIDWPFLESPWNAFQHPDYPLLVPLDLAFAALVNGGWDDRWVGIFYAAWGVSLVFVVRSLGSRGTSPACAALIGFAFAASCFTRYVGLAEGALIAFGAASVLFLREALNTDDEGAWRHGVLLLGFAANCKNEGVALLAAVTIGIAIAGPRSSFVLRMKRLWPAYALAAPWIAIRAFHALPTDLAGGGAMTRLMERLGHADSILALLAARLFQPWGWVALVAALLVVPAAAIIRERFVLVVTVIQLVFFVLAYFATPYDVAWHVGTSWPRLTSQLAVPISFVVLLMLMAALREPSGTQSRAAPAP